MCVIDVPFFTGQAIQRQLEEVAEKQRDLEERGVAIEKTIRGETERGTEPHFTHTHTLCTSAYRDPRQHGATFKGSKPQHLGSM